ncbi:DUF6875 domain-containing protein [Actinomadura rupiterrae]|uniref:DUF6875 domain-containing protein n=1 Tax=Actinomadura rupiterrae TaxID=559627 RepID=UPI0020A61A52|nr:hypothetical protein [Actinomadura rupiterrae]MCP2339002.1 hypothetical protein [Actinomadura rupiterrae]
MTDGWQPPRPLVAGEASGAGSAGACPAGARPEGAWPAGARATGALAAGARAEPLETVARWVRDYLCSPHPELGRAGAVCPYTRKALADGGLLGAVWARRPDGPDQVARVMRRYLDWFVARRGGDEVYRALLVAFPLVTEHEWETVIEGAQQRLKPSFVKHGLMVGEFHPGPPAAAGIRNPDFRPLRSPVPLLAVRPMVRSDLPFLDQAPWSLDAWTARFG